MQKTLITVFSLVMFTFMFLWTANAYAHTKEQADEARSNMWTQEDAMDGAWTSMVEADEQALMVRNAIQDWCNSNPVSYGEELYFQALVSEGDNNRTAGNIKEGWGEDDEEDGEEDENSSDFYYNRQPPNYDQCVNYAWAAEVHYSDAYDHYYSAQSNYYDAEVKYQEALDFLEQECEPEEDCVFCGHTHITCECTAA